MAEKKPQGELSLVAKLGLFSTITIVIGAIIGSGIFKKPALMASQLGSPELLIIIWVVAGIITLFGALTNVEISSMFSKTGGQYVYFQEMYGKLFGYLYGWAIFAVIQTGSIASISYIFGEYSGYFFQLPRFSSEIEQSVILHIPFIGNIFPLENIGVKAVTIGVITFLTLVNYFGVVFGGRVASFFTIMKVSAILLLVVFGFAYVNGSFQHYFTEATVHTAGYTTLFAGIIAALSGAFWAYDGWNNITYISGEVRNAQRNIPLGIFFGTSIVIIIYIIINLAYLYVLPIDVMSSSKLVATDVATASIGLYGGAFVAAAVMISTFGTAAGTIMVSARVYFAMSRDKIFFHPIGNIHPKFRTPGNALIIQGIWTSLLVLSGTFDILTDMLIFVTWIFYAFGAFGVFVLRAGIAGSVGSRTVAVKMLKGNLLFVLVTHVPVQVNNCMMQNVQQCLRLQRPDSVTKRCNLRTSDSVQAVEAATKVQSFPSCGRWSVLYCSHFDISRNGPLNRFSGILPTVKSK